MTTTKLIGLMVDTVQNQIDGDIAAYQPDNEDTRFVISTEENTVLVDADRKVFVPVEKRNPVQYMELKSFMKEVGLKFRSPTLYRS